MKGITNALLVVAVVGAVGCENDPVRPSFDADASVPALAAGGQSKAALCHFAQGEGKYSLVTVAQPSVPAHIAHGDALPGAPLPDHSGVLSASCGLTRIVIDQASSYYVGGTAPNPFDDPCPSGSAVVSLSGDRGSYYGWAALWRYSATCRELRGDGTFGATSTTPQHSDLYGIVSSPWVGECADGHMMITGFGTRSWIVSGITGGCASVPTILASGGAESGWGPIDGFGVTYGIYWSAACNPGDVITGVIGSAGDVIDDLGFRCSRIVQQTS